MTGNRLIPVKINDRFKNKIPNLMFLAGDTVERREQKIRSFLNKDPAISVLLAAANFEWTLCRALLFLSKTPNILLRENIEKVRGIDKYKDLWRNELKDIHYGKRLPEIVNDWNGLKDAFTMRNSLIHGQDRATRKMATPKVEAMLQAVADINEYW